MKKLLFADVGELGWSLYLSAHTRWYKRKTNNEITVYTHPFRECMFKEVDRILTIPTSFYEIFGEAPADCFGRFGIADSDIRKFFNNLSPEYELSNLAFGLDWSFKDKTIYKPYKSYFKRDRKVIIVFPRFRSHQHHSFRNLPSTFYRLLIERLCVNFPQFDVLTIGIPNGAYNIDMPYKNYFNRIGSYSIQDMIDWCNVAVCAIGGTSAPPKISLLQGVPTFMIGHELQRMTIEENWMKTPTEFWEIGKDAYNTFNDIKCIRRIIEWVINLSVPASLQKTKGNS